MTLPASILAAVDFSPDSRRAALRALQLAAAATHGSVTLLHVLEQSPLQRLQQLVGAGQQPAALEERAQTLLGELAAEAGRQFPVVADSLMRRGDPAETITTAAVAADGLLVLGAHGFHRLRELAVGTTAQRLVRRFAGPTLVVHRDVEGPYRRVLVATDFSAHSRAGLALAFTLAPDAEIHAVHAVRPWLESEMAWAGVARETIAHYRDAADEEAQREMRAFIAATSARPGRITSHVEHAYAPLVLKQVAKTIGADLLVVGKHGKSLTEELLLGSVTQHVLAEAPCDVLVASAATH